MVYNMKKNIYITALHLAHGGVEMAISLMSNAFVKRGYAVTILSIYNLGEPAYTISPDVKIEYLTQVKPNRKELFEAIKSRNPFKVLKEGLYAIKVLRLKKMSLIERIKQINNGVVISTRNEHSVLLSKYARESVIKIAQLHHDHGFNKGLFLDIKKRYNKIDYFTLLTDQLTQEITEVMEGVNKRTRCITMENFLAESEFSVDLNAKEKKIVAVGRLHPVKGFERLLTIWNETLAKHPDWQLVIVGDGEEKQKLLDLVDSLGIKDSVIFTGSLEHDKVLELMKRASIYAMTSYSEGFPFVLIEAMSCGLPVVAYDVRVGPRAIIYNNFNGILVEDNDYKRFSKVLTELIENEQMRIDFSKNAIERAKDFSESKLMEKWISIIDKN